MKELAKFTPLIMLALVSLGCLWGIEKDHETDEVMIENFNAHRAEFERLLGMFQEDKGLAYVDADSVRSVNSNEICKTADCLRSKGVEITDERLAQYRQLFKDLGLSRGIGGSDDRKMIHFKATAEGLLWGSSEKGYAYLQSKPEHVVRDLGTSHASPNGVSTVLYRQVDGSWYLYMDYED